MCILVSFRSAPSFRSATFFFPRFRSFSFFFFHFFLIRISPSPLIIIHIPSSTAILYTMVLLKRNRSTHPTILSLGQASSQFLVGLLLVLSPDNLFASSSSGSLLSWPSGRSSIMMAEASVLDSLNSLIRKKVKTEKVQNENTAPSLFDNVYSFAKKRAVAGGAETAPKKGPQQQQHQVSFQGTSQHLGQWDLLGFSGVSAMHATLIPNTNKIVFLEKVEKNTHAHLPENPEKFSWSVEFDIEESTFRSLHTKSNMFCSAGGYRPDGVSS